MDRSDQERLLETFDKAGLSKDVTFWPNDEVAGICSEITVRHTFRNANRIIKAMGDEGISFDPKAKEEKEFALECIQNWPGRATFKDRGTRLQSQAGQQSV